MIKLFDLLNGTRLRKKNVFFQYSAEEQFTGEYWVDGKKIYTKTFRNIFAEFAKGHVAHGVTNIGSYRTFDMNNSYWEVNNTCYCLGKYEADHAFLSPGTISASYLSLSVGPSWATSGLIAYVTIRYTKN